VLQVQYPASYNPSVGWTSVPAGLMFDSEDFEAFRGDTAVPVNLFMTCHDLLQTAFFDTVCFRCLCLLLHCTFSSREGLSVCAAYFRTDLALSSAPKCSACHSMLCLWALSHVFSFQVLALIDETNWQRIEAVLFALECASGAVHDELRDPAPSPATVAAVGRLQGTMQWLLPRLVPSAMPLPLMTMALKLYVAVMCVCVCGGGGGR
jgi:hypothetical protein